VERRASMKHFKVWPKGLLLVTLIELVPRLSLSCVHYCCTSSIVPARHTRQRAHNNSDANGNRDADLFLILNIYMLQFCVRVDVQRIDPPHAPKLGYGLGTGTFVALAGAGALAGVGIELRMPTTTATSSVNAASMCRLL
jgi:hypothetical protein